MAPRNPSRQYIGTVSLSVPKRLPQQICKIPKEYSGICAKTKYVL